MKFQVETSLGRTSEEGMHSLYSMQLSAAEFQTMARQTSQVDLAPCSRSRARYLHDPPFVKACRKIRTKMESWPKQHGLWLAKWKAYEKILHTFGY